MRRRWKSVVAAAALIGFCGLNAVAYSHARSMTRFVASGERSRAPKDLSSWEKLATLIGGVNVPRPTNGRDPSNYGRPFETIAIETDDGQTLEAWYIEVDNAQDLVILFHGYASPKASLLDEAEVFLQQGLGVLLVDFRGSGGSSGNETSIGWHEARDVRAAVDFARAHYAPRQLILYGMSMGAVSILRAVHVHGAEPDALILEAPFNRMLDTTVNRFHQMGLPGFPCAHLLVFWGGWQGSFDAFRHNPERYVESVHCPTLMLFGGRDENITPANVEALVARAGANVEAKTLEAGHSPLLKASEAVWTESVSQFVSGLRDR